jgi:nucleotide-binding universal stress UspA family protein
MATVHTILAAIDFSDLSATVMDYAAGLATAWQARLLVAHVVHDLSYFTGIYVTDTSLLDIQQRLEREAQERLLGFCQSTLGEQVPYDMLVVTGRPIGELRRLMQERQVDCLVLGAHSTDKPEHQLFGSTADRLIHQSPCPILVIPPPRASDFVSHG